MRTQTKRILIIDPDTEVAEELFSLFSIKDYDVERCQGITEATQRIKNVKFDCIIMDVRLPEIKGYEAVPILKTIDPTLEIIITTAENNKELESRVREQDIFYYYIKSFDRKELELAVHNVFQKASKTRKVKNEKSGEDFSN